MKLAPCPDCKCMCSVEAASCPRCGRVFQEGERAAAREAFEQKVSEDGSKSLIAAVVFVIAVVILFLIGSSARNSDSGGYHYPAHTPSANTSGSDYRRTSPGYEANAPILPRDKDDVEPLYNEVQRRKKEQGISDKEAVRQIIEEQERAKPKQ